MTARPAQALPVPTAGAPGDLAARCLALAVGGQATPQRLSRVIGALLDRPEPVAAPAVVAALEASVGPVPAAAVARAANVLERCRAVVHVAGYPGYPARLSQAWPELGAPLWLFARAPAGQPPARKPGGTPARAPAGQDGARVPPGWLPAGPAVAVVGTRQATLDGLETARALGRLLARHGVTVVSGLARGIDQAAQRGALDAGGATVGVLGTGFDVDYPRGHADLREAVAASGGMVTEFAPGAGPRPQHFLWRNRIIAALADATVVVEGRRRSGSLHTARMAASQGREVWAVPGSLNAPTSRGPLDLVRDGARVVTRLEDVLEAVEVERDGDTQEVPGAQALAPAAAAVHDLLGAVPAPVGRLAETAGLALPEAMGAVADLTARGLARATPGGIVRAGSGRW